MGIGDILAITVALLVLLGVSYFVFSEILAQDIAYNEFVSNVSRDLPSESGQFYPNLRFENKRIAYSIEPICGENKEKDIVSALEIISGNTILSFYESDEEGGITFLCSNVAPEPEQRNHFVAGEGGPTKIINASQFYIITGAQVSLFRDEKCETPNVALHETLHALGFDHNNNESSIMFPVTNCAQGFDRYITEEMDRLYGIESLPDLTIEDIKAVKKGTYLNFEIFVSNSGIIDSKSSELVIYSGEEIFGKYELNEIKIGARKSVKVENLRIGRGVENIEFNITPKNPESDLNLEDNKAMISPTEE
ncbi:MAG: matrixin family metalloprotease [Nanoarchaeota archaeon]